MSEITGYGYYDYAGQYSRDDAARSLIREALPSL